MQSDRAADSIGGGSLCFYFIRKKFVAVKHKIIWLSCEIKMLLGTFLEDFASYDIIFGYFSVSFIHNSPKCMFCPHFFIHLSN